MPFVFGGSQGQPSSSGQSKPATQNTPAAPASGFQFGGGGGQQENQQPASITQAGPAPLPFMAQALDKYNLPYYGEGWQGFARKTFAKIFDPAKLLPKPTERQAQLIEQAGHDLLSKSGEQEAPGWLKWVSKWTGIEEGEIAQASAAVNLATKGTDAEGNVTGVEVGQTIKTIAGTLYRGGGQVIATGLEVLSVVDKASRKVQAFNVALDDIGDSSTVLPDVSRAEESMVKVFGDTPLSHRLGGLIDAIADVTPLIGGYNLIRAATTGQSLQNKFTVVKDNLRASNMVYTMYWDEAKKDEYMRRVKAGENPDLLMRELENPWVELAGSILGDPSTYMGMGLIGKVGKSSTPVRMFGKTVFKVPWEVVGRVPGFTELLGLKNIGKARLLGSADEFTKVATVQGEKALMALAETADDIDAMKKVRSAMDATRKQVREFAGVFDETATLAEKKKVLKGTYGFFTLDAKGKANIMKKTVGTVMQAMAGRFRNTDDILDTFKAYKNLASSDDKVAMKAFMELKEMYGTMPFSHAGMQAFEFIGRLIDETDIPAMLAKHGNDLPGFADDALKKVDGLIDDMYPSVDDLAKGAQEAKQLGKDTSERQKFLAKTYDDLKAARPQAIWSNNVFNGLAKNKLYSGLQSFYAGTLMGMRPAYAFRNLLQNSFQIWHDLGAGAGVEALATGTEVFVKSAVGRALKQDWAAKVLERETGAIKKVLGFVPTQAMSGIGSAGREGFGFLAVGQDIEKVHSVIISRYVVEAEMEKALRYGGIPGVDALGLPKEAADRLMTHALETFGDVKETLKRFRAEQATGHAEVWRNLELDPDFKDTLRRANLLDELESIRKTAPDAVTFSEQFDNFVKKIDDLAQRTADEPALVSADNPLADVVVTVEKAFEEGGRKVMSEGELNQFRAVVELRSQLRNAYKSYIDVMRHRIGQNITPENMRQFEARFDALNQTLENGNVKWRAYADEVYRGVYAQSRRGAPPSELWAQVKNVMLDMDEAGNPVLKKISMAEDFPNVNPADLTTTEFNGMLWKWFKEKQSSFWRSYTQTSIVGQDAVLEDMAKFAGANIDEVRKAEFLAENNPRLQTITDLTKQIRDWEEHMDFASFADLDIGKNLADMGYNIQTLARQYGVSGGGEKHLLNAVNKYFAAGDEAKKFKKLTDIPEEAARLAFEARAKEKGISVTKDIKKNIFNQINKERAAQGLEPYLTISDVPAEDVKRVVNARPKPVPPYVEGSQPTVTRQLHENLKGGFREVLDGFKNTTLEKWGQTVPIDSNLTDEAETALAKWAGEMDRRTVSNRAAVASVANATRDFILHDYNKTYGDKFASFFTMYHYWPSRTYARWGERVVDTPGTIAAYAKFRATAEKVHSEQPEFYRYNMQVGAGKFLGLNKSPMFFNLEATLNPLYSLTGVDFNDPKRRVDWMSSAVDDMGKFGFNVAMPLQWAMAFRLYQKGEDEAARRWLGRLIPATQDLKAGLNLLKEKTGVDLMPDIGILPGAKYGDFDPFINAQGGMDAYEEKRIGRALSSMVMAGELTKEQALDIMYNREGPEFDEAVYRAINERAPGQMASYFLGVGFKTRTEGDMQVEEFYNRYYKLLAQRENISPEDYRQQFNDLKDEYEFADTVLLSARGGDDRDAAYAYNVIGRLPPSDIYQFLPDLGINSDMLNKFYEDKGDFSSWTPQDKSRFMGAMLDIGATFALPDGATRNEWDAARSGYKTEVRGQVTEVYGEEVWDVLSAYYDLMDTNKDEAASFKAAHPEIAGALQLKRELIINNPTIYKYYGSIDTIEAYFDGKVRAQLAEKYGDDITDKQTMYYNLKTESLGKAKTFLAQHPELKKYWTEKRGLEDATTRALADFANDLPTGEPGGLREDFAPANAMQEGLASFIQSQGPKSFEEITSGFSDGLLAQVTNYYQAGGEITPAARSELDYRAGLKGFYDAEDLLRAVGYSLQQGQEQETEVAAGPVTNPIAGFQFANP